jgi:hypothetical protein
MLLSLKTPVAPKPSNYIPVSHNAFELRQCIHPWDWDAIIVRGEPDCDWGEGEAEDVLEQLALKVGLESRGTRPIIVSELRMILWGLWCLIQSADDLPG